MEIYTATLIIQKHLNWEKDKRNMPKVNEKKLKEATNLLTTPDVIFSDFCQCDGVQDLHAMTGKCRKCGKECDY